ncbi:unnamed protein product, partial [Durusdinium trenchii]
VQAFAVCFGVFKLVQGSATLKSCLENLEGTLEWVESISADCRYIGEKASVGEEQPISEQEQDLKVLENTCRPEILQ